MDTITTLDAENFKDSVFVTLNLPSLSFRKQIKDQNKLIEYLNQLGAEIAAKGGAEIDTSRVAVVTSNGSIPKLNGKKGKGITATKPLFYSPALDALKQHLTETKSKITSPPQYGGYANPSGIMDGLFEIHKDQVSRLNADVEEANRRLTETWTDDDGKEHQGYLTAFLADYEPAIERARSAALLDGGLGPLFNPADYDDAEQIGEGVEIRRRFLAFGVPEGLPPELRAQAMDELRADLRDAGQTIKDALRNGLLELVKHGKEVLTVAPGEKPKVIKESLIGNVIQFCEVFSMRNTQNDQELAQIVEQCKAALTGINPEDCRKFETVREEAAARFTELHAAIDNLVTTQKGRRFDLTPD